MDEKCNLTVLNNYLAEIGIHLSEDQICLFSAYRQSVLEWNEKVNLTAIKDPEEFEMKHFVDSLAICSSEKMTDVKNVIDVGTGAGFPGIPLAIVYPDKNFVLMDSLGKRIRILEQIAENLSLKNVRFLHARAEELGRMKEHRESYDLCVSRAVANLSVLSEYCIPFVRVGGYFAAYKTTDAEEEINESLKAVGILGGELEERMSVSLKDLETKHQILWIKKRIKTLSKYPRKAGMPSKEPLK